VVVVVAGEVLGLGHRLGRVAGLPAGLEIAGGQVAVDAVAGDQRLDQPVGGDGDVPHLARVVAADRGLVFLHRRPRPEPELAAIAPRGAPADAVGLDERNVVTPLG